MDTDPQRQVEGPAPRRLIVVGAAAGIGRVLSQQLFGTMDWQGVLLVDRPAASEPLTTTDWGFATPAALALLDTDGDIRAIRGDCDLSAPATAVCLAVPTTELADVAQALAPHLAQDAVVFDTSATKVTARDLLAPILGSRHAFGIRPLFDQVRSLDGQTIVVTPDAGSPAALKWFVDAVESHGAIVKSATAEEHDRSMAHVQTMVQQSLLAFADALVSSDLDLEGDLWDMRTPAFEALLGLTSRTLTEHQQRAVASIQATPTALHINDELRAGQARLRSVIESGDRELFGDYIAALRDRFSGSLFDTVHSTATAVVAAAQAKRAELSRHRREGSPVGLVTHDRPIELRVGRISHLTPTEVVVDELLVGSRGAAFLLDGEGARNARKRGVGGKPRSTRFAVGRTDVLTGPSLDAQLDEWLAHIRRDVRFLVPESVAGEGVVHVIAEVPRVRDPRVISEVVRTGQRAVVVRLEIRADADVDATIEDLRARVGEAYAWPDGLSLPRSRTTTTTVSYLGPPGTFSETGALHCSHSLSIEAPALRPHESFEQVIAAVHSGDIGVLPIVSSSSGLVERATAALLEFGTGLAAGGVVDVPVRFDAYVPEGMHLDDLRGAQVISHPQVLLQCRRFIQRWNLVPVEAPSTAEAGRIVAMRDEPAVALAGAGLGATTGLRVAESEVDDLSGSLTRFLVLGSAGTFGELAGGSDPTLRTLWLAPSASALADVVASGGPAFDEFITGPSGRVLLVTSRSRDIPAPAGTVTLGRLPWTPRTPLVRLEA